MNNNLINDIKKKITEKTNVESTFFGIGSSDPESDQNEVDPQHWIKSSKVGDFTRTRGSKNTFIPDLIFFCYY